MGNAIKKWIVAVAIAIVFNLFVNYGIATFYPGPDYQDHCNEPRPTPFREKQDCEQILPPEDMQQSCKDQRGYIAYQYDNLGCATQAYCETCQVAYEDTRKKHDANVFVVLLIISITILVAGVLSKAESVSTGFLFAGILGLIIATIRYWEHLQDVYRFILLGVVLVILIGIGYKKVK